MILVTGATGLVGGHLLWHLLQTNDKVLALYRNSTKKDIVKDIFRFYSPTPELFFNKIVWVEADVLNLNSLENAIKGVNFVYHCAAVVSLGSSASDLIRTNVEGTRNVMDICLKNKVKKVCFVSSIAACGKAATAQLIDESCEWIDDPNKSAYSRSKFYSEQEVWKAIELGLNAVIVNPGVILGYSPVEGGSSLLFSQVKKGLIFYTNGGSGYVGVQDVVQMMIKLMETSINAERFVLVSENCSNKEILSWIADGYKKKRPFIPVGKNVLMVIGWFSEALAKMVGFTPLIDRGTARSATHRDYYSNQKIIKLLNCKFNSVEKCIKEVCEK